VDGSRRRIGRRDFDHRTMGFHSVGTYRAIGWKGGTWHDVAWTQKAIGTDDDPPVEVR